MLLNRQQLYYIKNKDKINTRNKNNYKKNKSKINSRNKKNYIKNREHYKLKRKEWYSANRENDLARKKEYYKSNKLEISIKGKKYRDSLPQEQKILKTIRQSAKKRGLEFNLDVSDIVIPEYCPVLGIKLVPNIGKPSFNSPSVDRIDNNKGYIKGNIHIISYKANAIKYNASIEELKKVVNYFSILNKNMVANE